MRLLKGTAASGQRRRLAGSVLSCVCKRHGYGELPACIGGLEDAGDDVELPIDRLDYAGHTLGYFTPTQAQVGF